MGTPIPRTIDEELLPLFLQVTPGRFDSSAGTETDAVIELYMPGEGSREIDNLVFEEIEREVEHWGFGIVDESHSICTCGIDQVTSHRINLVCKDRSSEEIEKARAKLSNNTLRKLVRTRFNAAGAATIVEYVLEARHIATHVILDVVFGALSVAEKHERLAREGILPELVDPGNPNRYKFPVPTILTYDEPYMPAVTAQFGARAMGLFLIDPIGKPVHEPLIRAPQ